MQRAVDILVGGGAGSEGKGLAAYYLASEDAATRHPYTAIVSAATAQAGHTAPVETNQGIRQVVSRHLPSAGLANLDASIFMGPGCVINLDVFLKEIAEVEGYGIPVVDRLYISRQAVVIDEEYVHNVARSPEEDKLRAARDGFDPKTHTDHSVYASTKEGVGGALAMKARRTAMVFGQIEDQVREALARFGNVRFVDLPAQVSGIRGGRVFLEGSQGYILSLNHPYYPKVTSRDCSAAGFLSMAGLAPTGVRDIYGVFRTFPIRVAGLSGPMPGGELSWEQLSEESGYADLGRPLKEITTVTKRVRRVMRWSDEWYNDSIDHNGITRPMLTFVNYINANDEGAQSWEQLSDVSRRFIGGIAERTGRPIWVASASKEGNWFEIPPSLPCSAVVGSPNYATV